MNSDFNQDEPKKSIFKFLDFLDIVHKQWTNSKMFPIQLSNSN